MTRPVLVLVPALIALTSLGAKAADLNTMMRQPGEWEYVMSGAGGMIPTTTQHGCYAGNKSIADLTTRNLKNCSQQSVSINGGTATVNAVCQFQKMTVNVQSTVRATSETSLHADTRAHIEGMPAIPGIPAEINMTIDAKRTGPCAPGEKPM